MPNKPAKPSKTFDQALKEYGYLGSLANSIPELRTLLKTAWENNYDNARFGKELQDSKWWKQTADSVKQDQILRVSKPGEYRAKQNDLINKTRLLASQMGVSLGEGVHSNLAKVVNHAMAFGWDETQLRQAIGGYYAYTKDGQTAGGTAGQIQQKIRSLYASQGLGFGMEHVNKATANVLTGKIPIETYEAQIRNAAASKYTGWAEQIKSGMTVAELAEPYRQSMSNLLEIPDDQVKITDPTLQRAMLAQTPDGKPSTMPLWQFEKALRKDPRRDKTKGAANEAFDVLRKIKEDWGV